MVLAGAVSALLNAYPAATRPATVSAHGDRLPPNTTTPEPRSPPPPCRNGLTGRVVAVPNREQRANLSIRETPRNYDLNYIDADRYVLTHAFEAAANKAIVKVRPTEGGRRHREVAEVGQELELASVALTDLGIC
ncbi:hypothetical protein O1611_g9755 [Lasiodiplodia mahajangana]|uniref:Uncharacterized protein n=1 Tax=Lasiodiplodia mahajangana TaxID=1108764 RepID=A0ACC2J611_9PEZI|nr:hypothetical protein O1611_g9755 [Lasiodiplodia mahajangana]